MTHSANFIRNIALCLGLIACVGCATTAKDSSSQINDNAALIEFTNSLKSLDDKYLDQALRVDYNYDNKSYDYMQTAREAITNNDKQTALSNLEKAIALNNSKAMMLLGSMYAAGNLVETDHKKAIELFDKAAQLNNFTAWGFLAREIFDNNINPDDVTIEDLTWRVIREGKFFLKALKAGIDSGRIDEDHYDIYGMQETAYKHIAAAMRSLGKIYYIGEIAPNNPLKSIYCYQESLDFAPDEPYVLVHLAFIYHSGRDIKRDDGVALSYAKQAVKFLAPEAYLILGKIYSDKTSPYYNKEEGIKNLKKACDFNITDACKELKNIK